MAKMSLQKLLGYAVGITLGSMAATMILQKFQGNQPNKNP
jgi:hypothetical protein